MRSTHPTPSARYESNLGNDALLTARQHLDQSKEILLAVEERLYWHAFVLAVGAHIVDVAGEPGMAVGRYPGIAQIAAVGRAGAHGGNNRRARPELGGERLDCGHDLLMEP